MAFREKFGEILQFKKAAFKYLSRREEIATTKK